MSTNSEASESELAATGVCNIDGAADNTAHITRVGHIAYHLITEQCEGVVYAVFNSTFYLKARLEATPTAKRSELADLNKRCNSKSSNNKSKSTQPPTDACDNPDQPILFCCIGLAMLSPGPLNISTTLNQIPDLSVGDTWKGDHNGITIGRFRLTLSQSTVWHPVHKPPLSVPSRAVTEILAQITGCCATPRHSPSERLDNAINATLTQSTTQLYRWLREPGIASHNAVFPVAMIGCGGGLTPAGDDIIIGVLAGLFVWNRCQHAQLNTEVKQHLSHTSELSAAHILCACAGSAVEPLHRLIDAMLPDTVAKPGATQLHAAITEAADNLYRHGHSSGYFAMTGLLLAAQVQNGTGTNNIGGV